jgi:hypothetical protein
MPLTRARQQFTPVHPEPVGETHDPAIEPDPVEPEVLCQGLDGGRLLLCPGQAGVLIEPSPHLVVHQFQALQEELQPRPMSWLTALHGLAQTLGQAAYSQVGHAELHIAALDADLGTQVAEGLGRRTRLIEPALCTLRERDQHGLGGVEGESGLLGDPVEMVSGSLHLLRAVEQHECVIAIPECWSQALECRIEVMGCVQVGQQAGERVALRERVVRMSAQSELDSAIQEWAGAVTTQAVEQVQRCALRNRIEEPLQVSAERVAAARAQDGLPEGGEDAAARDARAVRHHRVGPQGLQVRAEQLVQHRRLQPHSQRLDGQGAGLGGD